MTFNTAEENNVEAFHLAVLNLVINGWPSILCIIKYSHLYLPRFKPCYKWMTFNTEIRQICEEVALVLNLVINGWPSIHKRRKIKRNRTFKVLNLVINGWPSIPLPKGWMSYLC